MVFSIFNRKERREEEKKMKEIYFYYIERICSQEYNVELREMCITFGEREISRSLS